MKFHVFTAIFETDAVDEDDAFKRWLSALSGQVVIVEEQEPTDDAGGRQALGERHSERSEFEKVSRIRIHEFVLPMDLSGPPSTWEAIKEGE